jgi:hypothetical protein
MQSRTGSLISCVACVRRWRGVMTQEKVLKIIVAKRSKTWLRSWWYHLAFCSTGKDELYESRDSYRFDRRPVSGGNLYFPEVHCPT